MSHTYTPEELVSLARKAGAKSITATGPDIADADPSEGESAFLIYSHEHGAWWKPARWGYTGAQAEAGRYSEDEARGICERAAYGWREGQLPPEVMVPADAEDHRAAIKTATDAAIAARKAVAK